MSGYGVEVSGGGYSGVGPTPKLKIAELRSDSVAKLRGVVLHRSAVRPTRSDPSRGVFNFLLADSADDSIDVSVWGSLDALADLSSLGYHRSIVEITAHVRDKRSTSFGPESTSRFEASVSESDRRGGTAGLAVLVLDADAPESARLATLYREPILRVGSSLTTLEQVRKMAPRLQALGAGHVTVSALGFVTGDVATKTVPSKSGHSEHSVTEFSLVDTSGPLGATTIKITSWNNPFVAAMVADLRPFDSVILVLNAEAQWSRYNRGAGLTLGRQTVLVEDPNLAGGQALYHRRATVQATAAIVEGTVQTSITQHQDWAAVKKRHQLDDLEGLEHELVCRIDGCFLAVEPITEYIKRQPSITEDLQYKSYLEVEIGDLHGRAAAVVDPKAVETVLGHPRDLVFLDLSAQRALWSRLISARHDFVVQAEVGRKSRVVIKAIAEG